MVHIQNVTCYIKAVRGKLGVLYSQYTFVNADDVVFEMKFFYRNSKGRYLPFIADVRLPFCDLAKEKFGSLLNIQNKLVFDSLRKKFSTIKAGCPLNVREFRCF